MSIKINSTELKRILEITPASQNIMLVGKHGIGKSEILEKFYTGKGYKVVPLFLGQMSDPGDLIGLLNKNEKTGKTEFMPPYWFPTDNQPVVLFLDELNRARPEVLQTIMDLALNRKLAGRSLPEGSRIISAVNNGEEYQLTDLDPALVSRFNVFEFVPSVSEWLLWATENKLDDRVIKFISENPSYLDGAELRREDMGLEKSPDRRAWTRLANILKGVTDASDEVYKKISAGIVGMAAATKFFSSLSGSKMLSAADILLGKFDNVSEKLKSYTTPELAIENENLYRFIESKSYEESKSNIIAENFTKYFALLVSEIRQEALGHFANQFTAGMYPSTVVFIMTKAPDLYKKLNRFIKDL